MKQNILINHKKTLDAKLYNEKYYDFMLFGGGVIQRDLSYLNNLCIADFSKLNIINGILYSDVTWSGATNSGVELNNIGFTGVDNGLISFKKDRITNEQFLELYLNSQYKIESEDTRLFLTPITGNTQEYNYPMFLSEDKSYISFKGGFYQGFFKLQGHDYQVLPDKFNDDLTLHFEIRPRTDYEVGDDTINKLHPNNKGIFFYIGTRAENKFWPFYKTNKDIIKNMKKVNAQTEGYFSGCNESGETYSIFNNPVVYFENKWVSEELPEEKKYDGYFNLNDGYFSFDYTNDAKEVLAPNKDIFVIDNNVQLGGFFNKSKTFLNTYDFNPNASCYHTEENEIVPPEVNKPCNPCCDDYFIDAYYDNKCSGIDNNNKFVSDDYIGSGVTINSEGYNDSEGHLYNERGYFDIVSDNKFLLFDRTPSGCTTNNWVEGTKVVLTGRKNWPNANYFVLMNRTKTGYTTQTIEQYNKENEKDFDIYKDLRCNTFALKINDDGSIGYRYGMLDCENENKYSLVEEYSKPNIIKMDTWNNINVRIIHLDKNKMKIMFYVNGYLVFISQYLDSFNFKSLDDVSEKQEAVPYNISIGGGSLGLLETIVPNYYAISEYVLPIERDYCGSFLGDLKSFKIYNGEIDYSIINNYLS